MLLAMRCRRPVGSSASAAPRSAKLSASVPPLVNTISDGSAPMSAATADARVVEQRLGALAEVMDARRVAEVLGAARAATASTTAGSTGVVALWSK